MVCEICSICGHCFLTDVRNRRKAEILKQFFDFALHPPKVGIVPQP